MKENWDNPLNDCPSDLQKKVLLQDEICHGNKGKLFYRGSRL